MKISIDAIVRNPQQPRTVFDAEELKSLAESLKNDGLLNPISLEATEDPDQFILLDGERRWRAAQLAGWNEIEANVRAPLNGTGSKERLFLALVGNLQRADMGPVDEGKAYKKLEEMGFSQAEIAQRVGRSTSNINSKMRLLNYPVSVQKLFNDGRLPLDERIMGSLRRLDFNQQESVAKICAGKKMTATTIMGICSRILREKQTGSRSKADNTIPDSKCPPLSKYPAVETMHGTMKPYIEETCKICGLYDDGGVRSICPSCPMMTLAKLLSGEK